MPAVVPKAAARAGPVIRIALLAAMPPPAARVPSASMDWVRVTEAVVTEPLADFSVRKIGPVEPEPLLLRRRKAVLLALVSVNHGATKLVPSRPMV
ncbi:hypothetical protein D3C85_1732200 [compost metagenome]